MVTESIRFTNESYFISYGLSGLLSVTFQHRNLIIGKNGSGKSRFLHALCDMRKQNPSRGITTVILDFPSLIIPKEHNPQSQKAHHSTEELGQESQSADLYSILFGQGSADFTDFLALAARDSESLIADIVNTMNTIRSQNTRIQMKNGLTEINKILLDLLNYQIVVEDNTEKLLFHKMGPNGNVIRDLPIRDAILELSPGQRLLFYICFFLVYLRLTRQTKLVLIMDEPELHLHPQALLKIMDWLYCSDMVEELWVASHSLFLVPFFHFSEITVFDNSSVLPRNSTMYRSLYDTLVGLANIDVFEMLKSLDGWQYYEFIVECFCLPTSVGRANPNDEQFLKMIRNLPKKANTPLRILDYGAGKFRIWECLQVATTEGKEGLDRIHYEAFEPYPDDAHITRLQKTYGINKFPLYRDIAQVPQQHYDAVVLMNVLHEIDVNDWVETFKNIKNILMPNGILILLEVETLSLGEQPYGNTGYLILGEQEIKKLFCDNGSIISKKEPGEKSNCWAIPYHLLDNVSKQSVKACIEELELNSKNELELLFSQRIDSAHVDVDPSCKKLSARKYAFLSQQFINAMFAQKRLEQKMPKKVGEREKIIYPGIKKQTDF